jgi:hypothetical protein
MDSKRFDSIVKSFGTGASRRGVLRGLTAATLGAVVAVTGSALVSDDAVAGKKSKKARKKTRAARERHLGDACQGAAQPGATPVQANCASNEGLVCEYVGQVGAQRCECNTAGQFQQCGNQCFSANCAAGTEFECVEDEQGELVGQCSCPAGTESCQPKNSSGDPVGSSVCVADCPEPRTLNNACECACPSGQQLCSPAGSGLAPTCVRTTCTRRNQNFNANCCSCQNPGQPSGVCK